MEHLLEANRYITRCRRAGETASVYELLARILAPNDAARIRTAMFEQLGAAFVASLERVA